MSLPMKILVLGGTQFLGRHIVEAALRSGHRVTLLHRGRTNPGLFPDAEEFLADRDGGLGVLRGRGWDATIDVNGYVPRLVSDSTQLLAGSIERYVFISTLAAYADRSVPNKDERAPLRPPIDASVEEITNDTYAPLKVACERRAEAEMPGRVLIVRPGFIVGPCDHTGRFTYWLRRASKGGEMLAPGEPDRPLQFIDARDLAAFVIRLTEEKAVGAMNATGPRDPYTWERLFEDCRRASGNGATVTWVSEAFLEEKGVAGSELPMWVGSAANGLMRTDCRKAFAAGLALRPVTETIRDTLAWDLAHPVPGVGLSAEREREVLAAWRASAPGGNHRSVP